MYAVNVCIYRGKAYLPAQAKFQSGIWVDVEPVYTAGLNANELVAAIGKVIETGYAALPDPTREEWKRRKSPLLEATKARGWKALARNGASYSIYKKDNQVEVDMSYTDETGRWQNDPEKARTFPRDTPLERIVEVILEDVRSRPEVLE